MLSDLSADKVLSCVVAIHGTGRLPMFGSLTKLLTTSVDPSIVLIRLIVGAVFLSEGIQKFVLADIRGAGRFAGIGLPAPELLGPFVGGVEILCGALVLAGALTRVAALPLLAIMLVAIATTKAQLFAKGGLWEVLHGSRTDWSMLLGSVFLLIRGGGGFSVDRLLRYGDSSRAGVGDE